MNRSVSALLGVLALGWASAPAVAQEPTFSLDIDAPQKVKGAPESTVAFDAQVSVSTAGLTEEDPGAQGWSLSIACEDCAIVSATTDGTAGANAPDGLRNGGFEKTELTTGDGNEGVVSAIVLSFEQPVTLPTDSAQPVLNLTAEAAIPSLDAGVGQVRVFPKNGLRGSGQPVDNKITWDGQTYLPTLNDAVIELQVDIDCTAEGTELAALFQSAASGETEDRTTGVIADSMDLAGSPGEKASGRVWIAIASQLDAAAGVQGWSLSVSADGLDIAGATTEGTVGANAPAGLRSNGFEKTEVVDPLLNDQGQGVVSAVVLSFTEPVTLLPAGIATVLCVDLESSDVVTEEGDQGLLSFVDGLRGAGQPVSNVATVAGTTADFCKEDLVVNIIAVQVGAYISGDGNGDARLDIADPIFLINYLFRQGPAPACTDSADPNGDGLIDLSDATYLIQYLFFAGLAPTGSLECAVDPESTVESCPAGASACDV